MERSHDISTFLDTENSITVKWIANSLCIGMDEAFRCMSDYKTENSSVSASYLLVGENPSGSLSYIIASDDELASIRQSYKNVLSERLYALHKIRSISNKSEIQALEYDQASEILMMAHPNSPAFLKNSNGYITCPSIDVKQIGQRILSTKYVRPEPVEPVNELVKKTLSTATTAKTSSTAAPTVIKSKSSIQASNFFGAAKTEKKLPAATPAVKDESAMNTETATKDAKSTQKRVGKVIADDDDDEEFDSEYKPDPTRLKERVDPNRREYNVGAVDDTVDLSTTAAVIGDAEGEEDDSVAGTDGGKKKGSGKRKQKGPVVVHGAMDDYFEDVAIAKHNQAVETPADAPKPKRRKLVEKMFADEKGYLVTSMVWEEVTDDEGDAAVSPEPVKRQKASSGVTDKENGDNGAINRDKKPAPAVPTSKAKKAGSEPAKGGQQKSMMSFFGKK